MNTKTCNSCKISLPTSNFTEGKKCCKSCRNNKAQQSHNKQREKEWILKRTPLRNEFLRQCFDDGLTLEEFNCLFIKKEDFDEIVEHSDYDFAKSKVFQTDFILEEDFEKGYVIDCMMCGRYGERKLNQIFFII